MTTTELKERYIYAATKRLPRKARADIARELDGLIEDMLTERCGNEEPTEKDLRVIFAEIGQPAELHRKYSPSAETVLLGPPYYEPYLFVLKIVLAAGLFGLTLAFIINLSTNPVEPAKAVLGWLFSLASAGCGAFTFLTLLFVFFSRRSVDLKDFDDEINSLAPVPKGNHNISKGESITGIVFTILFGVVLLIAPGVLHVVTKSGEVVPIFNAEVLRSSWVWLVLFIGACLVTHSIGLIDGRYTKRVVICNLIAGVLSFAFALLVFGRANLINPAALVALANDGYEASHFLTRFASNFNWIFLGLMAMILIADASVSVYKYYRYEKNA